VDGSRIRNEKVADSKISGYVWTGPESPALTCEGLPGVWRTREQRQNIEGDNGTMERKPTFREQGNKTVLIRRENIVI